MTELTALPYSPWSEKARWALDHHRIDYKFKEHVVFLGEIRLRILLRRPTGIITVPVLFDGGRAFTDSFDIAKHADQIGAGTSLFPPGKREEIEAWNRRSEEALAAGRAIGMIRAADSPEALRAIIPPSVPALLAPLLESIAKKTLETAIAKYRMREGVGSHQRVLDDALDALSAALASTDSGYLVGDELSYADIAMAVVLQLVSPVDTRFMALGPGGREGWTNKELMERHPSLLAWRDGLYEKHRKRREI
jgi:glutathione S-transferase